MKTDFAYLQDDLFGAAPVPADTDPRIEGEEEIRALFNEREPFFDPRFELRAEAYALMLAHAHNKILSLSNSRTRILAHQVESTHRIVNALNQRFLIADEVGLGKTIEAGLVIKELVYRYGYKRILIVTPASLLLQWQHEMESKFNERFTVLDRKSFRRERRGEKPAAPWGRIDKAICSLDFIKNASFRDALKRARWDAIIFDEAHRLRRDSLKSTLAYNVAEVLAENARALLLLTATPFRGKIEELYYLVRLLDKNLLGPFQSFYSKYCIEGSDLSGLRERLSEVMIRRTKKEVGGFTKRFARTVRFDLFPDERALYDATTRYVAEEFNRAIQTENRAVGFVMTVFQKLLDSSSHALCRALSNRRANLAGKLARLEEGRPVPAPGEVELPDIDDPEDLDGGLVASIGKTMEEMGQEIGTLDALIGLGSAITRNKKGEKLRVLLKTLSREGHGKFIIFTQFRTTQDYLKDLLAGFDIVLFNGSMNRDEKEEALKIFKERAQVLISTEAGGEGRNMQFCNILINYDLPWSPLKVEQRIGRVHRFGQPHDVYIYNFSTRDTVAERVLEVLARKLQLFEESIGMPDVLLGQIEDEVSLNKLFMEMASGRRSRRALMEEIDRSIQTARKSYEKLSELTVTRAMDFNYDEYYAITMKERQFSHRRVESLMNRLAAADEYAATFLGSARARTGLYPVKKLPGGDTERGRMGTFDSRIALEDESLEFLAFGHPLIEHLFGHVTSPGFGGRCGIKRICRARNFDGVVFYYLVAFSGREITRALVPVVVDPSGGTPDHEIGELERQSIHQEGIQGGDGADARLLDRANRDADALFAAARARLAVKTRERIADMMETIDLTIDPEIQKIRESADLRMRELKEQLERQECQGKWFNRDMRGALTRTKNEIARVEAGRDRLLAECRRRTQISHSVSLVGAGLLIARPGL
ncbi:MAG: DEAD/DEAH box helicase [Spirochaetes bacterium]|nr:MAG: DEAD/DEAH box helicase [Spirochaetota bacterium]